MTVGQLVAYLELKSRGFISGLAAAKAALKGFKKDLDSSSKKTKALGDALQAVGKPALLSSLAGSAVALAGALQPAAGAAWLLPAALAAAGAAGLTAKAGLIGFGDALKYIGKGDLKKFQGALDQMAPSGKKFAQMLWDLNVKWSDIRRNTQEKLFGGLPAELSALAGNYLPILDAGMGKVAISMNGMAKAASAAMNTPFMQGVAAQVFTTTAGAVSAFTPAVGGLITSLGQVIKVGLPFIAQFAQWAGKALTAKAAFLGTAQGAQYLHDKISASIGVWQQLGRISGNILKGLQNAMNAGKASGQSLLTTIEQLTAKFAAWSSTAQGQQQLNDLLNALVTIAKSLAILLPPMAGALTTVASAFAKLPVPVQQSIGAFLGWSLLIGRVLSIFKFIPGLLVGVGGAVIKSAAKWGLLGAAARTAANGANGGVRSILGAVARMVPGMARTVGQAALRVLGFLGPWGRVAAAVITGVILIITHWDKVKAAAGTVWTAIQTAWGKVTTFFSTLPTKIGTALSTLGTTISTKTGEAWDWLWKNIPIAIAKVGTWLLQLPGKIAYGLAFLATTVGLYARDAWDWLWKNIPIAIAAVGTWLAGLPAQVGGWLSGLATTVGQKATEAWHWLKDKAVEFGQAALDWISALPGKVGSFLSSLPSIVGNAASTAWSTFKEQCISVGTQALTWIQELPGKIKGFFAGAASWLVSAGAAILEGLWNGLKSKAQAVLDWISNIGKQIAAGFHAAIDAHSPSKIFDQAGVWIMQGLLNGLNRLAPTVLSRIAGIGQATKTAWSSGLGAGLPGMQLPASPMAGPGSVTGAIDQARTAPTIIINNPTAERGSDTLNREARTLAALGVFG